MAESDPASPAQALVARTTAAQGLPAVVDDPTVLANVAALARTSAQAVAA